MFFLGNVVTRGTLTVVLGWHWGDPHTPPINQCWKKEFPRWHLPNWNHTLLTQPPSGRLHLSAEQELEMQRNWMTVKLSFWLRTHHTHPRNHRTLYQKSKPVQCLPHMFNFLCISLCGIGVKCFSFDFQLCHINHRLFFSPPISSGH